MTKKIKIGITNKNNMEVEGYPGLIKTINDDDEVECYSEDSDEEEEV